MAKDLLLLDDEALNRERVRLGLTRGELAGKAGVSVNALAHALAGRPVGLHVSRRVVAALGLELRRVVKDGPVANCA